MARATSAAAGNPGERHQKDLVRLIRDVGYRSNTGQVFSDFIEMAAIAVSNSVDAGQRDLREKRYLEIAGKYDQKEMQRFSEMYGLLVLAMDAEPRDVLGAVFHELELSNQYKGQFFTPYTVSLMMAKMTVCGPHLQAIIDDKGFIHAMEPSCGAGGMIVATATAMREEGINYQQHLHMTAVDLDQRCVHMTYLQMSILHVPGVVVHGNSLSLEEFGHWYTPAHVLGGWPLRLRIAAQAEAFRDMTAHAGQGVEEAGDGARGMEQVDAPVAPTPEPPRSSPEQLPLVVGMAGHEQDRRRVRSGAKTPGKNQGQPERVDDPQLALL